MICIYSSEENVSGQRSKNFGNFALQAYQESPGVPGGFIDSMQSL
jgi:hypothetical protein